MWSDCLLDLGTDFFFSNMVSLVTSIFLYACESRVLTAELQRRIQAMEMKCYRKILYISYKDFRLKFFFPPKDTLSSTLMF